MLNSLKNVFGFLSIIPTGMPDSLEGVAKKMYLFPLVGAVLGLLAGLILSLFLQTFPPFLSAALGFFSLLALTGLHHLDGLLDFGDALILRGSREKRIEVMHTPGNGVGGFYLGVVIIILGVIATNEFILSGGAPLTFFLVSETLAKLGMVFAAGLGKVSFEGTGSLFVRAIKEKKRQVFYSLMIAGGIVIPILGGSALILFSLPIFSALVFVWISNRIIGGTSGDVFGAVNEVTRIFAMMVIVWML
jgi:adenosylcobinamide-GDP ribazoletransferase